MALQDPVAVYNAANNLEAHFVCEALQAEGIEAFVTEDISQVGTWVGGLVPELHKPQVWVERTQMARAQPVLEAYEQRAAQLRQATVPGATGEPIAVTCEACGRPATFPATQYGSVQECPHCRAYIDVGDEEEAGDWSENTAEEP